ncbi:MAG TPA: hypothetical protein PLD54_03665, partial [Candidatus Levybacteria bacterium]|nr:hypothetical protein [Candidatus Levybacteria bacterium]
SFYKLRAETNGVAIEELSSGSLTLSSLTNNGVYHYSGGGNLTINTSAIIGPRRLVILSEGDITINDPITLTDQKSIIILASKRDIIVNPNVGETDPNSDTFNIQAILSAEGNINLPSGVPCPASDKRLNIEGTLIANADNPFGKVVNGGKLNNNRDLCELGNQDNPSLYVKSRLSFVTQLTDFYKISSKYWNEIAP